MIKYRLQCANGHSFDDWFDNSAAYKALEEAGALTCPDCGGHDIKKGIMAPAVAGARATEPLPAPACGAPACGAGMCPSMAR